MREQFANPGVEWRGKPFWSWNGKLEKDELLRQLQVIREMGMGGFFMHSRTGLETEYLGPEWFELVNLCADKAEEMEIEAWLYDEDRWPSGLAGGLVSRHPEFRQKAVFLDISTEPIAADGVIAQWTAKLDGAVCTELEPFDGTVPAGKKLLTFRVIEQGRSGFYNGFTYIDTMNRDATEAFLQCTHERYAEHCGDRLGRSIKGVFTDEPHRGSLLDGFSMYMEHGERTVPYTQKLFDEFHSRFGYDLKEKLPELFLQVEGRRVSPVKWHFTELLQQLFLENFAIPCKEWCEKHNLILSGHILHEDNLTSQTAMSGSVMRYYEQMTAPGVDVLTEGNRNYWIVKQCASAARQTGKKLLLSELYGCAGWQMPFAGHKAVGDWQVLLGVNLRCHHLSWYTMRGESKRDYPASILHQSPWYRQYTHVEDYFARFGMMMTQGEPVCDLLVVNPVESFWAQVYLGWSRGLGLQDAHLKQLEQSYQTLFTWLLESQIDFDYGDEEMLSRLSSVVDGVLTVGCAQYKTVLVCGMDTIRSSTLELLQRFAASGGRVVVVGDAPAFVDALACSDMARRIEPFRQIPFEKEAVLAEVPPRIAIAEADDLFGQVRMTEEGLLFAVLNVNREERREKVTVRIQTELPIVEWNCETGERIAVETRLEDGWRVFTASFPVGGLKLWVAQSDVDAVKPKTLPAGPVAEVKGPYAYRLSEPNICVLDAAEYRIGATEGDWQPQTDVLKIDRMVRDRHGVMRRGGEMCQPWFTAQHPVRELDPVELRFSFEVDVMPAWTDLVLEEPDRFAVEINGRPLDLSVKAGEWVDIAFHRVRIPAGILVQGRNEVTLKTMYRENSNLEAIYLVGEFGVALRGTMAHLNSLPERLDTGDICPQGLPFYSGAVIYRVPLPSAARWLRLPELGGACAVVNRQVLGWDPFEASLEGCNGEVEVEIYLSRRNTFGPLHDTVQGRAYNGPDHWLTEGGDFSAEPLLLPSGLLVPPQVG